MSSNEKINRTDGMDYVTNATVLDHIPESSIFSHYVIAVPNTHVPLRPLFSTQLLGTSHNTLYWFPPDAGTAEVFAPKETASTRQDEEEASDQAGSIKLRYSCAKDAADARRGANSSWQQVPNPSFPTTDEHDRLYVMRMFMACADFSQNNPGDSETAVKAFAKILRDDPARIEQGCWGLYEETKLRHIANANEYKSSGPFAFSGNFDGHITALCNDLLAVNKTACKTICSNCNGLAAIVDNPGKRKRATELNHEVNKKREYKARANKRKKSKAATATTEAAATADNNDDHVVVAAAETLPVNAASAEELVAEQSPVTTTPKAPAVPADTFVSDKLAHEHSAVPFATEVPTAHQQSAVFHDQAPAHPLVEASLLGKSKRKRGDAKFSELEGLPPLKKMRRPHPVLPAAEQIPVVPRQEYLAAIGQDTGLPVSGDGPRAQRGLAPSRSMTDGEWRASHGVDYAQPYGFTPLVTPGLVGPSADFSCSTSSLGRNDLSNSTRSSMDALKKHRPNINWDDNPFADDEPQDGHGEDDRDGFNKFRPEDYLDDDQDDDDDDDDESLKHKPEDDFDDAQGDDQGGDDGFANYKPQDYDL